MSYTVTGSHTIYMQDCITCGIEFGVPNEFDDRRRSDGKSFHCPNGHSMSYTDSTEKKLKREQEKTARLTARLDQERARSNAAERRASAARGQVTKIKKRIGRGVCPCCNRSFEALAEHMKTEHPEFAESSADA